MTKVRFKSGEFSLFESLELGEFFLYKDELYVKINENTAYCFITSDFDYFVEDNEVEWIDEDRITITVN